MSRFERSLSVLSLVDHFSIDIEDVTIDELECIVKLCADEVSVSRNHEYRR